MNYEFKKLSDVDVVAEPAESANVLIEENGVIKKAPKTAVGGSSSWDAIIDVGDQEQNIYSGDLDWSKLTYVSGDYISLRNKLDSGDMPKILIKFNYVYGDIVFPQCFTFNQFRNASPNIIELRTLIIDGDALFAFSGTLNNDGSFGSFATWRING